MNYGHQRTFWTEDRIAMLRKLAGEGLSAAQIADRLGGISRNAVVGKAHREKIALGGLPFNPRATVRQAHHEVRRPNSVQIRIAARAGAPGLSSPRLRGEDRSARRDAGEATADLGEGVSSLALSPSPSAADGSAAPHRALLSSPRKRGEEEALTHGLFEAPPADPVPFLEAVDAGGCLFFAGDPMAPDGPDMPVCGAPRDPDAARDNRYCRYHNRSSVDRASTLARMRLS